MHFGFSISVIHCLGDYAFSRHSVVCYKHQGNWFHVADIGSNNKHVVGWCWPLFVTTGVGSYRPHHTPLHYAFAIQHCHQSHYVVGPSVRHVCLSVHPDRLCDVALTRRLVWQSLKLVVNRILITLWHSWLCRVTSGEQHFNFVFMFEMVQN